MPVEAAARYFPPPEDSPTFVEDTEWYPLVDGAAYFAALDEPLRRAGPGDTVLIAGFEIDPSIDLGGRAVDDPAYEALGDQLARLAADGVDVRILIAGRVFPASLPWGGGLGPFRANARAADAMRRLRVPGARKPPLAKRVLIDFSGALLGSNHQKAVTVHVEGELTSFVSGIDLGPDRYDAAPHDRLRLDGERWGWHDMAVRLRGAGARQVWETFRQRWQETLTLPNEHYLRSPISRRRLNPRRPLAALAPAPRVEPVDAPGVAVRVLRSTYRRKVDTRRPSRHKDWDALPPTGLQQVFRTFVTALSAAERYIYIEDQYLEEYVGGDAAFELYPHLLAAALRGVKVILVGSGTRDPEDAGPHTGPINRKVNKDLQAKLIDPLPLELRDTVAVYRVENCTVHAKLLMIDDAFAAIGSANMFSRSMSGVDSELTAAVVTTTSLVRDLRVAVWGEHLRAPMNPELTDALEDVDLALGIWRVSWLPDGSDSSTWRVPDQPKGFVPDEQMLALVGPS